MNYLIFRGVSTQSLDGVYIGRMPSHKKAKMRYTEYYVKGRDGALHVDEGYANFDMKAKLVLVRAGASARQIVNAWADGTGKLITSDDLTKAYMASVKNEVTWYREAHNGAYYDTAEITFNCQPCMYEAVDTVEEFTADGAMLNPGSADAFPLIAVEGNGNTTITIAGSEITIEEMTPGFPVYIDCENGYVYTSRGATEMRGELPYFPVGTQSAILLGQGATKVTITPHWRWV